MSDAREAVTRGVVIGRAGAGEGSVKVQLYTEGSGLVLALAKSAREERSKLRAHLMVGTFGTFALVRGDGAWRVTGATDTENSYFASRARAEAQEAAARVVGVVRRMVHGEGANAALFGSLWSFLERVPELTPADILRAEQEATLGVLAALGYVSARDTARSDIVAVINKGFAASGLD